MDPEALDDSFRAWRERHDGQALARVFDELAPELYAVARHLARGSGEAEDLVQQAFLAALERAPSWDGGRPLRPWLFGILGLEARKLHARRRPSELEHAPAERAQPADVLLDAELREAVGRALESLPPQHASAVALHLEDGLSPREIAPRLSISAELARTHLSRGLAALRRALPEGLSAGAWIASPGYRALRKRVLAGAGVVAAPGLSLVALCALLVLPVAALGGGVAWLLESRAQPSSTETGAPVAAEPRAGPSRLESPAPAVAREALVAAPGADTARVHGRILLAGGTPATGTEVRASASSKDLGSARCDARGEFALALDVGEGQYVGLRTKLAGFVSAGVSSRLIAPGSDTDMGELVLPRAGVLLGTLVDAQSRPLAEGWQLQITADAPQMHPANKRWVFWGQAEFDPGSGNARVEGLPAGDMKVAARSPLSFEQMHAAVRIVEGAETPVTFRYDGPDLRRRLVLRARPSLHAFVAFDPAAGSVTLQCRGEGEPGQARAPVVRASGEFLFDDLPEGEYTLELDDPQFEHWSEPRARPGHAYSAALEGAAALKLRVIGSDGAPILRYGLQIAFPDALFRPNTGELWAKGTLAPADGLLHGLVPVHCSLTVQPDGLPERTLDVPALRRGETRELTLDYRASVALAGRVVDDDGKPLAGVAMELTQGELAGSNGGGLTQVTRGGPLEMQRPIAKRTTTDAAGAFVFSDLERGSWTVRARFGRWLVLDRTQSLASGSAPALELARPASGFLVGSVAPATVRLVIDDDLAQPALRPAPDGSFRVGPLPVGTHSLMAWVALSARSGENSAEEFQTPLDLGRFEIQAGRETQRTFDLSRQLPARIVLQVRAGGAALAQGWVVALRDDQPVAERAESIALGEGGRATLGLAPLERVRLALVARELGWVWTSDEVLSPAAGEKLERTLDVPLVKHRLLCLDAATKAPLGGQELRWGAKLAGLEAAARGTTDANGLLELSLPAGEHEFFAGSASRGAKVEWNRAAADPIEILLPTAR